MLVEKLEEQVRTLNQELQFNEVQLQELADTHSLESEMNGATSLARSSQQPHYGSVPKHKMRDNDGHRVEGSHASSQDEERIGSKGPMPMWV